MSFPPMARPTRALDAMRMPWEASPRPRKERLLGAFKIASTLVALFLAYTFIDHPSWTHLGSILICITAMLPAYIWCSGRVPGVPLFPLYAITFLWTYAYPLVSGHPIVASYSDEAVLIA